MRASRELPISFTAALIPPIQTDLKTVTRRIVHPQPEPDGNGFWIWRGGKALTRAGYEAEYVHTDRDALARAMAACYRYQSGDRLWVKECYVLTNHGTPVYRSDCKDSRGDVWNSIAADPKGVAWKSSRFMPKRYARIWLEALGVTFEPLQEISEEDAVREGVTAPWMGFDRSDYTGPWTHREAFGIIWDRLYKRDGLGMDKSPWVARIQFRRLL